MGLKIVIPIGYQRVKRISLTAMPFGVLLLQKEERLRLIISNTRINKSVTEILKYNTAGRGLEAKKTSVDLGFDLLAARRKRSLIRNLII